MERIILGCLMRKPMKVSSLDTLNLTKLTGFITKDYLLLKSRYTSLLVNLIREIRKRRLFSWCRCIFTRHSQRTRRRNWSAKSGGTWDNDYEKENLESPTAIDYLSLSWRTSKDHLINNILGDITKGATTHSKISNFCYHFPFISQVEPKNSKDALLYEH